MSHAGTARVTEALNCAMDQQRDGPTGLSFPGYFGMAARLAYRVSGLSPSDIDFVELHDCFSLTEILDAEDLGVVPRGAAGAWTREGRTAPGGDMPINVSGGLLAKGHPVGATGVGQLYEAVRQLRSEQSNPVKDAAIGMTHNLGGAGVVCTVSILKRADA
jgi:acetyl-CoA C-acetyltransferase